MQPPQPSRLDPLLQSRNTELLITPVLLKSNLAELPFIYREAFIHRKWRERVPGITYHVKSQLRRNTVCIKLRAIYPDMECSSSSWHHQWSLDIALWGMEHVYSSFVHSEREKSSIISILYYIAKELATKRFSL